MATIMLSRGRPEVIAVFSTTGLAPNDYRIPQDIQGARLAWAVSTTGTPATASTTIETSVDGINWSPAFDTSTAILVEARVVTVEGLMGIRSRLNTLTGGSSPTVTVTVRCA